MRENFILNSSFKRGDDSKHCSDHFLFGENLGFGNVHRVDLKCGLEQVSDVLPLNPGYDTHDSACFGIFPDSFILRQGLRLPKDLRFGPTGVNWSFLSSSVLRFNRHSLLNLPILLGFERMYQRKTRITAQCGNNISLGLKCSKSASCMHIQKCSFLAGLCLHEVSENSGI